MKLIFFHYFIVNQSIIKEEYFYIPPRNLSLCGKFEEKSDLPLLKLILIVSELLDSKIKI